MTNFKTRLTYFWRNVQTRFSLILTACNFGKPLPQLITQQQQFAQKQKIDNQLVELGVGARLPAELETALNDDIRLRQLVTKQLGEECFANKQVTALLEVVVAHAKSFAQQMPLLSDEPEPARERIEKWRIQKAAPLLLAAELILINEQREFSLPVFAKHKLSTQREWRRLVARAYDAVDKHLEPPTPFSPERENQKLYIYPLIEESNCGIWVGNENGVYYGPSSSIYFDVSGELCANLLTARGVQLIAILALRHRCGYFPSVDLDVCAFDPSSWDKSKKDKHSNKSLSNYIPELKNIYIMGNAHEWTTVAAEAEKAYNRQLTDPTTDNQWQLQLRS